MQISFPGVLRKSLVATMAVLATAAAQANPTIFRGSFAAEAVGATGTGTLSLVYDEEASTLAIDAVWSGLSALTTTAHIHCCTALPNTGTAGVALANAGMLPGFPTGVTAGRYTQTIDLTEPANYGAAYVTSSGGTVTFAESRLIANLGSGNAYFNIHTSAFPAGEIRAFVTAVPEPHTYALMLAGLGLLGMAARRRARVEAGGSATA